MTTVGPPSEDESLEGEPPAAYHRRGADGVRRQLQRTTPPITDPALRARLQRELDEWERLIAAAGVDEHWASGEGDRRLF